MTMTFEEILNKIDELTTSDSSWLSDYEDELMLDQNNEHHLEGEVGNHVILMLETLKEHPEYGDLTEDEVRDLEQAIMWSDLGKLATYKDSPKKTWPNGRPQGTAFGHDKKSAMMYLESKSERPRFNNRVFWIIKEHQNAHKLKEMDEQGKTGIPEFLKPQVEDCEPGFWPEWHNLDIPHGESLSKKAYAWIERGASKLLRIKQYCDDKGRKSEVSF